MVHGQRGGINIGCILGLVAVGLAGWHAFLFGIPYLNKEKFEDKLFEQAEFVFHYPQEEILKMVKETAIECDIPLDEERVKIRETQSEIFINVSWDVPVKTFVIDKTVTYKIEVQRNFSR